MANTECEFNGLLQQLCAKDEYRLCNMPFVPDVILDIGANVGVFTSMARFFYPHAKIVSVEPNPRNWELFLEFTGHFHGVTRLNMAIGTGDPLWHCPQVVVGPYYGGGQQYFTMGQLGAPNEQSVKQHVDCHLVDIPTISLDKLVADHVCETDKVLMKIDIEGGEQCFFSHAPSWAALRRADYLAMEVHFRTYGTGIEHEAVRNRICHDLLTLGDTHECTLDVYRHLFYALKKKHL